MIRRIGVRAIAATVTLAMRISPSYTIAALWQAGWINRDEAHALMFKAIKAGWA